MDIDMLKEDLLAHLQSREGEYFQFQYLKPIFGATSVELRAALNLLLDDPCVRQGSHRHIGYIRPSEIVQGRQPRAFKPLKLDVEFGARRFELYPEGFSFINLANLPVDHAETA